MKGHWVSVGFDNQGDACLYVQRLDADNNPLEFCGEAKLQSVADIMNSSEFHGWTAFAAALKHSQPGFTTIAENHVISERKRGWLNAVNAVADALAQDSESFDRKLFLNACGAT